MRHWRQLACLLGLVLFSPCAKSGRLSQESPAQGAGTTCTEICGSVSLYPTMEISTTDRSSTIASAHVVSGPCTHAMKGPAQDASTQGGYDVVQITYRGPQTPPIPLCLIDLVSVTGQEYLATTSLSLAWIAADCCPSTTCCTKDILRSEQSIRLEFDHPSQSITFPPLSDASVAEDVAGEEETYPSEAAKRQED